MTWFILPAVVIALSVVVIKVINEWQARRYYNRQVKLQKLKG